MKREQLLRAIGEINEQYIEEAAPGERKRASSSWIKWAAAACACLAVCAIIVLPHLGHGHSQKAAVTPPSRIGTEMEENAKVQLPAYSMEDAYRASTAVAHVRVGNWLGCTESDEGLHFTFFEVTTVRSFKGDLPETFVLAQYGDTKVTWINYPLYTFGDELLVFLSPYEFNDMPESIPRENTYRSLADKITALNVAFDKSGNVYYIDSFGNMGRFTDLPRQNGNDDVFNAVREDLMSRDPVLAETAFLYPFYIYSGEDVEQLLMSLEE